MKYLSEKIVLKLLNLEKIDRSIVISDPSQKIVQWSISVKNFQNIYAVLKNLWGKIMNFFRGPKQMK